MKKSVLIAILLCNITACTTAGPYVTNISADGNNGLYIEKCAVKLNSFMGTISTADCTSQNVKVR